MAELTAAPLARRRVRLLPRLNAVQCVWLAVGAFVAVTAWWLTADGRVPDYDSGVHMLDALTINRELASGQFLRPFTDYNLYPPLVHTVGALAIFVSGLHPSVLIMSSNLVFVPLLAFGCFGVGRIAYGPRAGVLAAVVALGCPMVVSMMHEYDLDPPQAAMVAVSVWALLESRRFERTAVAALAGVLTGLALLTKETSFLFLGGVVAVALVRSGRSGARGRIAYGLCTCLVAGPWYVLHASQLGASLTLIGNENIFTTQSPPRFSVASLTWYAWNLVNQQLLLPFTLALVVGIVLAMKRLLRGRLSPSNVEPELLGGLVVSYVGMTMLVHKDPRYTLPLLVFAAVLATGWIATLAARRWRAALTASVVVLAGIYLVGLSTGLGGELQLVLPGVGPATSVAEPGRLTMYETAGWVRGAPSQDGHVEALLEGLRHEGVAELTFYTDWEPVDFNPYGLTVVAKADGFLVDTHSNGRQASLVLVPSDLSGPRPCERMADGSKIYAIAGHRNLFQNDPSAPNQVYTIICPGRPAEHIDTMRS